MAPKDHSIDRSWLPIIHWVGIWLALFFSVSGSLVGYGMLKSQVQLTGERLTRLEIQMPVANTEIRNEILAALKRKEVSESTFREHVIDAVARIETQVQHLEKAK